jgi:hypothetical protein
MKINDIFIYIYICFKNDRKELKKLIYSDCLKQKTLKNNIFLYFLIFSKNKYSVFFIYIVLNSQIKVSN